MFLAQIGPDGGIPLPQQALYLLLSLLGRSRQLEPELRAELERMGIAVPSGGYCIALFELDAHGVEALPPLDRHWKQVWGYEQLNCDLCKQFAGTVEGFLFLAMGYLVGILFSSEEDAPQRLSESVLAQWTADGIGKFSATFSRRYQQLSQVTMAYEEASSRQRSRLFFGDLPKLLDGEAMAEQRESLWSSRFAQVDANLQQLAQRICGSILSDQAEQAHAYLDEAVDLMLDEGAHTAHFVELQMLGSVFSARLSGALKQAGVLQPAYEAGHAMSDALLESHDDQQFRQMAHDCLTGYLDHYRTRQAERSGKLMAALRTFLEEHVTDPQIGLGMAAKQFSAHPATLATGFRKAYGESVGDFINRLRVQKAKELLLAGNCSVQEVSERVGFCSGTTMYRAFLRYEGRPPKSFKPTASPEDPQ
jgi:AraC-like DNA-binding protein